MEKRSSGEPGIFMEKGMVTGRVTQKIGLFIKGTFLILDERGNQSKGQSMQTPRCLGMVLHRRYPLVETPLESRKETRVTGRISERRNG